MATISGTTNSLIKFTDSITGGNSLVYDDGTNVGIGTTNPAFLLDVFGTNYKVRYNSGGNVDVLINRASNRNYANVQYASDGIALWAIGLRGVNAADGLFFHDEDVGKTRMMIDGTSGNVGIGTTAPDAKLDVAGSIKINDGTEGEGKVLTSDANGMASWQNGPPTYAIGLWPELGGYVFWVSADGKHGLVAETQDQGTPNWYEAQNLISNPANHSVNGQKFRDWRLPTIYELNEMFLQKVAIGGFAADNYWSSAENGNLQAWVSNFGGGVQIGVTKITTFRVRAVRAF